MERVYRLYFAAWLFSLLTAVITAKIRQPPVITKFTQKDLIDPEDVTSTFTLPCEASGTNLTWAWRYNDKEITNFNGIPYSLSKDGTLHGKYLAPEQSGTYQCFVKDETTGVEVFSRKLKVAVTAIGEFINRKDVVEKVDLGQSFQFQCPQHTTGFGATYSWLGNLGSIAFGRDKRRGISPKGTLFITHVTQEDIDEIEGLQGIECRMSAGNSYDNSGTLKLERKDPQEPDPNTLFSPYWADVPAVEEVAIEGRSKTLYCFAIGRPEPTITWKKNGRQIHGKNSTFKIPPSFHGRLLTITSVSKTNHQDRYTCEAENSQNKQPLIRSINLVVKVPPRWSEGLPPRRIDVIIRRNETIECKVMANPEATITWYKNGKSLQSLSDHLRVDGNKLHLRNVNLTDEGVYQCAAENKYGMIVSATWIRVKAWKPSFANEQFGPFSLLHGSEGRLQCKPSAEPQPTFQWFRNGVLVHDGINSRYMSQPDGTLVIKKVDKDKDSVNYTCKAQNMMGQDSVTTVPVVLVRPSFITKPQNQTVIEKETVTFYCNASGNPIPSITWVKDGKTMNTGNTLRFETTWRHHSGRYWCWAQNGLNVTIKASADLNVQFLPIFTRRPSDQRVKEGEKATFYCTATGNPTPKLTWHKDGKAVGVGETLNVAAHKNHSGKYWCSADNGLGLIINASAYLNVQFEPRLITKPRDQTVSENKTVTFNCTATGNPTPKITWTKDGMAVGTGSELTFIALRSDAGRYWCSADNGLSADVKASAYLHVFYVPFAPSNVTISDCSNWTVKISWVPDPSNDASITHYLIEQESNGDPVVFRLLHNVTSPNTRSVALNLTRESVLRFRVKAVNSVGASRPSLIVETICKRNETKIDARKVEQTPIYHKAWFLTLMVLVAYAVLFALLVVLYRKYKGKGVKYEVAKRERKRGLRDEVSHTEEETGDEETSSLVVDNENNPPEEKQQPDRRSRPISNYSMFEVQFREDGSFTEEYGEGDEMFQTIQGTFV